jgi:hypothetical protein
MLALKQWQCQGGLLGANATYHRGLAVCIPGLLMAACDRMKYTSWPVELLVQYLHGVSCTDVQKTLQPAQAL